MHTTPADRAAGATASTHILPRTTCHNNLDPRSGRHLRDRGISDATARYFMLQPYGAGWLYPVSPDSAAKRWKAYPGRTGAKYRWHGTHGTPADLRFYDPRGDLAQHIQAQRGALILCEGEPDVWALFEAGIRNATATMRGAGAVPEWLAAELQALAVDHVYLWPDLDDAGARWAARVRAALADSGIAVDVRALPADLGAGADIGRLLLTVGARRLPAALYTCRPADLPEVAQRDSVDQLRQPSPAPIEAGALLPGDRDLWARWCQGVQRQAIEAWQIAPPNDRGLSRRNFSSPLRQDRNPSAQWNYDRQGFTDYGAGEFYNTHQVAALLNLESWDEFKARNRAPVARQNGAETARFALGMPYSINWRLMSAHRIFSGISQQHAGALVLILFQLIPSSELPDREWFTQADFRAAAQRSLGYTITRRAAETGLAQLGALIGVESVAAPECDCDPATGAKCAKCNLYTRTQKVYRLQKAHLPPGRRPTFYRFPGVSVALATFSERWATLAAEKRFANVPADALLVWRDHLTAEQAQLIDDLRAPAYAQAADQRAQARELYARDLEYLRSACDHILAGNYQVVALPEGAQLTSPKAYRDALHRAVLEVRGAAGAPVRDISKITGRSRASVARAAQQIGAVTVPQTRTIKASEVTDRDREFGRLIRIEGDTAIMRAPNVQKLRDHAAPEELQQARAHSVAQAEWRARRQGDGDTSHAIAVRRRPAQGEPIPNGPSLEWQRRQLGYMTLPAEIAPYDPATGELHAPGDLVRLAAEYLAAQRAERAQDAPGRATRGDLAPAGISGQAWQDRRIERSRSA